MLKQELINKLTVSKSITIPMWLKRVRPDILQYLEQETIQYDVKNVMERVYIVLNGEPPKCSDGNYRKFDTFEKGYRLGCNLNHKCKDVVTNRVEKQKITLMNQYGVSNAAQLDSVKEKIKNTNLKRYGVEHHSQNETVKQKTMASRKSRTVDQLSLEKEKRIKTSRLKYGVDHHMQLKTQQEKVQSTNNERYDVSFPLQNKDSLDKMKETFKTLDRELIKEKTAKTLLDKYGVTAPSRINISTETLTILDNKKLFEEFIKGKNRRAVLDELKIGEYTLYLYAKKYEASHLFIRPLVSQFEIEVAEFLDELNIKYEQNVRTVISPKEIDFYLPEHNLAIECCGLYWHSELSANRTSNYHYNKHKECMDKGIQLLTIFDDEWNKQKSLVKQILINKLVPSNSLYARKCNIIDCNINQAKEFINNFHIQQYTPAKVKLGLTYNEELVAVMTLGKSRFSKTEDWEIIRYCSSQKIIGGASKLLNRFVEQYNPSSIVSYSDNRYFTGGVYNKMGFEKVSETVGYFYTNYHDRHNRIKFQKHKLVQDGYDETLTEWEIMQQQGFDRVWDCGQIKWVKRLGDK